MPDCVESIGVIAKGEVITKPIVTGLNSILCGSDGVWNFCTPDDLACSVKYSTDLAKTAVVSVLNMWAMCSFLTVVFCDGSKPTVLPMTLHSSPFAFRHCRPRWKIGTVIGMWLFSSNPVHCCFLRSDLFVRISLSEMPSIFLFGRRRSNALYQCTA